MTEHMGRRNPREEMDFSRDYLREHEHGMCRLWAGASPCAAFVTLGRVPGTQAGPPGKHRAPVGLVVRPEPPGEGGFILEAHERRHDQPADCGVQQQSELAHEHSLADDSR